MNIKIPQEEYLKLIKENVKLKAYVEDLIDLDANPPDTWEKLGKNMRRKLREKGKKLIENG